MTGDVKRKAGHDLVCASGQQSQHPAVILFVCRFAQRLAVQHDQRIRADHSGLRVQVCDRPCLACGQSGDFLGQIGARTQSLVNVGRTHRKVRCDQPEQLLSARGL